MMVNFARSNWSLDIQSETSKRSGLVAGLALGALGLAMAIGLMAYATKDGDPALPPEVVEPLTDEVDGEASATALDDRLDVKPPDAKSPGAARAPMVPDVDSIARRAWQALGDTTHQCDSFDYFPNGGMRNFYCHLRSVVDYPTVVRLIDVDVFESGPHQDSLNLSSAHDFGRYNPEFVRRLSDWTLPAAEDESFRRTTQPAYDRFVAPLARTYWATHLKLSENDELWASEASRLEALLDTKEGVSSSFYERYFYFLNPGFADNPDGGFGAFVDSGFDGGVYSGNVVKSAVGFWLRRRLDGTAGEFKRGLDDLMRVYDEDFVADPPLPYRNEPLH